MAVGTGVQVMAAVMEADVAAACGPRGKHNPDRAAVRHGREQGSVKLGGRRVGVSAAPDASSRWLQRAAGGLVRGVHLYRGAGADGDGTYAGRTVHTPLPCRTGAVGEQVEQTATNTSNSAVSRKFVKATETALPS